MPTHGAYRSFVELQVAVGSVHVAATEVKPEPVAAMPPQLPPLMLKPGFAVWVTAACVGLNGIVEAVAAATGTASVVAVAAATTSSALNLRTVISFGPGEGPHR